MIQQLPSQYRSIELDETEVAALNAALNYAERVGNEPFGTSQYDEDAGVYVRHGDDSLKAQATGLATRFFVDSMRRVLHPRRTAYRTPDIAQVLEYLQSTGARHDIAHVEQPQPSTEEESTAYRSKVLLVADEDIMRQLYTVLSFGYSSLTEDGALEREVRADDRHQYQEDVMSGVGKRMSDDEVAAEVQTRRTSRSRAYRAIGARLERVA